MADYLGGLGKAMLDPTRVVYGTTGGEELTA